MWLLQSVLSAHTDAITPRVTHFSCGARFLGLIYFIFLHYYQFGCSWKLCVFCGEHWGWMDHTFACVPIWTHETDKMKEFISFFWCTFLTRKKNLFVGMVVPPPSSGSQLCSTPAHHQQSADRVPASPHHHRNNISAPPPVLAGSLLRLLLWWH